MFNWRDVQCGTIPLRSASEGGQHQPNLQSLKEVSEQMSCGGMYVPGWRDRNPHAAAKPAETAPPRTVHLVSASDTPSLLLVNTHSAAAKAMPSQTHAAWPLTIEHTTGNTEMMVKEIGYWWNKN